MLNFDYLFIVIKQFNARKLRTLLTMLAIGIGIGAMFLLISFVFGLQDLVMHRIAPVETLSTADVSSGKLTYISDYHFEEIKKLPNVTDAVPIINLSAQASIDDEITFADILVNATDPKYIEYEGMKIVQGKNFLENSYEALITTAGTQLFTEKDDLLGKSIYIRKVVMASTVEQGFEIDQLLEKVTITGIIQDDDSPIIYIDINNIKNIIPEASYSGVKISIDDVKLMEDVKEQISNMGFEASAVYDMVEETSRLFTYLQAIFALFGIVGLVVAAIGMFNTMTISLLERTRDIGFMRAFGISKQSVKKLFVTEAALIGFGGGIFGTMIGVVVSTLINNLIRLLAKKVESEPFDLFMYQWWMIVVIVVFSIFLGIFTGIYPAKRAAGISSLEAIRYE